jgi:transposase
MKAITKTKENEAVKLLEKGLSVRKVSTQLSLSSATIGRISKKRTPERINAKPGRPKLLSDTDKRKIIRDITSGKCKTATQASSELAKTTNVNVSADTIRRALKENGLFAAPKIKKPLLSLRHRKARLEFANSHKDWTVDDWYKVVWSDETKINCWGSDGREWCWKYRGEAISNRICQPTIKHGGGSLIVWGCMTVKGIGYLTKIEGNMDANLYCEILKDELANTLSYYDLEVEDIIFQHDNDPKHTSKKAKACLNEMGLKVLAWPAQSPDLNPIEHLWGHLKHCLSARKTQPTGMLDLWERVQEEWEGISQETVKNLIDSMPCRIKAVIKAKGGPTKY